MHKNNITCQCKKWKIIGNSYHAARPLEMPNNITLQSAYFSKCLLYPTIQITVQAPEWHETGFTGMHIKTKLQNLILSSDYQHITTM